MHSSVVVENEREKEALSYFFYQDVTKKGVAFMKGPFYVKDGDEYVLSDICRECAFGDEKGCIMLKCIAVPDYEEDEED